MRRGGRHFVAWLMPFSVSVVMVGVVKGFGRFGGNELCRGRNISGLKGGAGRREHHCQVLGTRRSIALEDEFN